jgi:hypothetical protein
MIYGYARVAADGESVDAREKQLRAAGVAKRMPATGGRSGNFFGASGETAVIFAMAEETRGSWRGARDLPRAFPPRQGAARSANLSPI